MEAGEDKANRIPVKCCVKGPLGERGEGGVQEGGVDVARLSVSGGQGEVKKGGERQESRKGERSTEGKMELMEAMRWWVEGRGVVGVIAWRRRVRITKKEAKQEEEGETKERVKDEAGGLTPAHLSAWIHQSSQKNPDRQKDGQSSCDSEKPSPQKSESGERGGGGGGAR